MPFQVAMAGIMKGPEGDDFDGFTSTKSILHVKVKKADWPKFTDGVIPLQLDLRPTASQFPSSPLKKKSNCLHSGSVRLSTNTLHTCANLSLVHRQRRIRRVRVQRREVYSAGERLEAWR
jgi:hypothetical protein